MFDPDDVVTVYSLEEAIADGVLVEILKNRWKQLTGGRPIVATAHLYEEISLAGLLEVWNEFVCWKKKVYPTLTEEERLFATTMNSRKVWVIEDEVAFTLLYPEDYWFLGPLLGCILLPSRSRGASVPGRWGK